MVNKLQNSILLAVILCSSAASWAQQIQFPESYHTGVRPIDGQVPYGSSTPVMIPINSATQAGIYPSSGFGSPTFDPYSASQYSASQANASGYFPSNASPFGVYPTYSGSTQPLPSGTVGGVLPGPTTYTQPGV